MLKKMLLVLGLAVLVAGGGALAYVNRAWFLRPNFDKVGGTEVVFEAEPPAEDKPFNMDELCRTLTRRIDPTGIAGVVVKPDGEGRVLIRVPSGKLHDGLVEALPALTRSGSLELIIVANSQDDRPALEAARATLKKEKEDLARREARNEPPPPPRGPDDEKTFPVALAGEPEHSYRWAELGKPQVFALKLTSAALDREENAGLKKQVEDALASGEPFVLQDSLYYVRAITSWDARSKRDRELGKKREFFVLLREPQKGKEVTGDFLAKASAGKDSRGRPCVNFTFNSEGGDRFFDLTSRNKSDPGEAGFRRHLAIVFDGKVTSAPMLISAIRRAGQITGEFTPTEVEDVVRILQAGALPARLRPEPVEVRTVGPAK